ncbi:ABC transporter ATP-binding protein [Psychromonas sp. SR45-3]|uniref:ABC transporter ATP-binding protein n=1 Tax=Psychromonas sp. SR45-3 TaxID=2760930 RepID=UPI0015FA5DE1|nr:ABC transporter ATP-binding protein [Psychromonas sp. SR45-3]MBB1272810.1 ABC transporter ATP-binding protein [Psychromonas sp. SR45-3]
MLSINNISKGYNIDSNEWRRILTNLGLKKQKEEQTFWALKDVNFTIKEGETVGIIGKNGSGKSTLLQIIAGTLKPTSGNVIKPKKIAALLELGAGFNPEFSGRENIYLNGALIGMSQKEIRAKYNDIINFSEIEEFIDRPVKTYSSGMFARLAFSIAVHSQPDLLIVDEALSVGDASFQEKSINKMKELKDSGIPIFFVSHSISMVRNFCTRAIWISKGKIRMDGEAKYVCQEYLNFLQPKKDVENKSVIKLTPSDPSVVFSDIAISENKVSIGGELVISVDFEQKKEVRDGFGLGVIIFDEDENFISIFSTVRDGIVIDKLPKSIKIGMPFVPFKPGKYSISVSLTDELATFHYDRHDHSIGFTVEDVFNSKGLPRYEGQIGIKHDWNIE